jgi:3',5'-cyclic AMP phosphodiesterase CpdA
MSCKTKRFYRYFENKRGEISHPIEFFTLKEHRIEAHNLQNEWWVVLLDTAIATNLGSAEGTFSLKLESYLKEVLNLIPKKSSILILNHYPFFQNDVQKHNLVRGEELQKILEKDPRIKLYLHGHTHRHIVADLQTNHLPIVLDSGSCAQGKRGSWNLIDLSPETCTVSSYKWDQEWRETEREEFPWTRK